MTQVTIPDMETARRVFEEEEERSRNTMPQYTDEVYLTPSHTAGDKKASVAAALCWPIIGIFGLHHFYLRREFFGIVYACTVGLFGLGWLVDCCRIGRLVRKCNEDASEARAKGHWINSKKYPGYLTEKSFLDALLLWLPPFGMFGLYHFYLGRKRYGMFHACSLGFFMFGWFIDLFRLSYLVEKANTDVMLMKKGTRIGEDPYATSDAYLLAFPLGMFGLHHFYMGNPRKGAIYACTGGILLLGWVSDLFQMPMIVAEANKHRDLRARLQNALRNGMGPQQNVIVMNTVVNQVNQGAPGGQPPNLGMQSGISVPMPTVGNIPEPPPAYRADAVAGETVLFAGEVALNNPEFTASTSGTTVLATEQIPPKS